MSSLLALNALAAGRGDGLHPKLLEALWRQEETLAELEGDKPDPGGSQPLHRIFRLRFRTER